MYLFKLARPKVCNLLSVDVSLDGTSLQINKAQRSSVAQAIARPLTGERFAFNRELPQSDSDSSVAGAAN